MVGHFVTVGQMTLICRMSIFNPSNIHICLYTSLWINSNQITSQNMLILKYQFFRDGGTFIKMVSPARSKKIIWEVAQCFHVSIMVNSKRIRPKNDHYMAFSKIGYEMSHHHAWYQSDQIDPIFQA